jgi:hypothetical protein
MGGFVNDLMPISGLTLSLFDGTNLSPFLSCCSSVSRRRYSQVFADMGWWKVNKSFAEFWGFGKNQGCEFLDPCGSAWMDLPSSSYWCTSSTRVYGCSADSLARASCIAFNYGSSLDPEYQNFANPAVTNLFLFFFLGVVGLFLF